MQVDSKHSAVEQYASLWIFGVGIHLHWQQVATLNSTHPPENAWLEIHLLLHIRDLQRTQQGRTGGGGQSGRVLLFTGLPTTYSDPSLLCLMDI